MKKTGKILNRNKLTHSFIKLYSYFHISKTIFTFFINKTIFIIPQKIWKPKPNTLDTSAKLITKITSVWSSISIHFNSLIESTHLISNMYQCNELKWNELKWIVMELHTAQNYLFHWGHSLIYLIWSNNRVRRYLASLH